MINLPATSCAVRFDQHRNSGWHAAVRGCCGAQEWEIIRESSSTLRPECPPILRAALHLASLIAMVQVWRTYFADSLPSLGLRSKRLSNDTSILVHRLKSFRWFWKKHARHFSLSESATSVRYQSMRVSGQILMLVFAGMPRGFGISRRPRAGRERKLCPNPVWGRLWGSFGP